MYKNYSSRATLSKYLIQTIIATTPLFPLYLLFQLFPAKTKATECRKQANKQQNTEPNKDLAPEVLYQLKKIRRGAPVRLSLKQNYNPLHFSLLSPTATSPISYIAIMQISTARRAGRAEERGSGRREEEQSKATTYRGADRGRQERIALSTIWISKQR